MPELDVISLTSELIAFNSVNPPGNERAVAEYIGNLLSEENFIVNYIPFSDGRIHLMAEKGIIEGTPPVIFSGHLDVVPIGAGKWESDPFSAVVRNDKLFGRGSSDMKGALAAMIVASVHAFRTGKPVQGVRLIFTAGEETGCQGVQQLVESLKKTEEIPLIIVGEPTANVPFTAHKGAIYLKVVTRGHTAHSSMPELGVNAIYKAAKAILKVGNLQFDVAEDPVLGFPTINVGRMSGGLNLNSVPDYAEFTIDVRTTRKLDHFKFIDRLKNELEDDTEIEILTNVDPLITSRENPLVKKLFEIVDSDPSSLEFSRALPYLTDGSALQKYYNHAPVVVLGPGQPEMAHKTDEFCYLERLRNAVAIYKGILMQ